MSQENEEKKVRSVEYPTTGVVYLLEDDEIMVALDRDTPPPTVRRLIGDWMTRSGIYA